MLNPRLASRYAKSLLGLAIEKEMLNTVFKDMEYLQAGNKRQQRFCCDIKEPNNYRR